MPQPLRVLQFMPLDSSVPEFEVGPRFELVQRICKRLYSDDGLTDLRMAPSIITRSECELFCLSTPRFALRAYLNIHARNRDQTVLINVRRLNWFHAAFSNRWKLGADVKLREDIVTKGKPIADSLFLVPTALDDYHVLTCDLAHYYGETWLNHQSVPFMQHLQVGGGGMCAQACIFMALCLQERWGGAITGVAELTIMAKQKEGKPTANLLLNGLFPSEMAEVLSSPTLRLNGPLESPSQAGRPMASLIEAAWHSYVRSGVPVICIIDSHKVSGVNLTAKEHATDCIWGLNKVGQPDKPPEKNGASIPDGPHAVLLVGTHHENGKGEKGFEGKSRFLINDPASSPLMRAPYEMLAGAILKERLEWIPVLPAGVKYSLLPEREDRRKKKGAKGLSLLEAAREMQTGWSSSSIKATRWKGPHPGRVRLLHRKGDDWQEQMRSIAEFNERSARLGQRVSKYLEENVKDHSWLWIQVLGLDVPDPTHIQFWIWDADTDYAVGFKQDAAVLQVFESPEGEVLFNRKS